MGKTIRLISAPQPLAGTRAFGYALGAPYHVAHGLVVDAIVADIYWIRAVQYFGRTRLDARPGKSYDLLYPLLDITTTLDPQFNLAYRFGAVFLAEAYPGGAGQPARAARHRRVQGGQHGR